MFTNNKIALLLFFSFILAFSAFSQETNEKQFIVVLDAGHGGKDPGTPGTKRYKETEKHTVLEIALRAGKLISDNIPNTKVVYTRTTDVFLELRERSDIANDSKADIFISIHTDGIERNQQKVKGSSCYVMGLDKSAANIAVAKRENAVLNFEEDKTRYQKFDVNDPSSLIGISLLSNANLGQSIELAKLLQGNSETIGEMSKGLGVRQGLFYVICYNTMPSALLELGYLTNNKDEDYMRSDKGRDALARSIFKSVAEYKRRFFDNRAKSDSDVSVVVPPSSAQTSPINYRVQLFSSSSAQSPAAHPILKQFKDVRVYKENNMYKFTTGREGTHEDARKILSKAYRAGAKDAFIVAFDEENRITIQQAKERNGGK